MKSVSFLTKDGVEIVGDYYALENQKVRPAVLLLHMMPSDRKSWISFAEALKKAGMSALAIDLRGHGESIKKQNAPILNYKNFSDKEHQESILDIEAAVEFLKEKGFSKLFLAGASIGANLSLKYLSENGKAKSAILLSAGLNYKGIEALPLARNIKAERAVFIVGAKDDIRSGGAALDAAKEIFENLSAEKKEIKIFETGGHGTGILEAHQEFQNELVGWLEES